MGEFWWYRVAKKSNILGIQSQCQSSQRRPECEQAMSDPLRTKGLQNRWHEKMNGTQKDTLTVLGASCVSRSVADCARAARLNPNVFRSWRSDQ